MFISMVVVPTAKVWNLADVLISMYEDYICHPIAVTNFLNVRVYEKKRVTQQGCVSTCVFA